MTKDEIIETLIAVINSVDEISEGMLTSTLIEVTDAVKALPDPKELSRDEFAAAALPAFITEGSYTMDGAVEYAWRTADAMLKERAKR
jgi:hypothetical protein